MNKYSTYFKGSNFMTPEFIEFRETGQYAIELSSGNFMNRSLYGVTVKEKNGHDTVDTLSVCFPVLQDAQKLIALIESGNPDNLKEARSMVENVKGEG